MIFAAETEERSLHVFPDAFTAAAYCEGIDVEATVWLFWDDDGSPLEPHFTVPNKRGLLTGMNGIYHLVPARDARPALLESLGQIRQVISDGQFATVAAVQEYVARRMADRVSSAPR